MYYGRMRKARSVQKKLVHRQRRIDVLGPAWREKTSARIREVVGNYSLYEISKHTGLNRESIRRHLHRGRPSVDSVVMLCKVFGVSADWILGIREPLDARVRRTTRTRTKHR